MLCYVILRYFKQRLRTAMIPPAAFVAVPRLPPPPFDSDLLLTGPVMKDACHWTLRHSDSDGEEENSGSLQDYQQQRIALTSAMLQPSIAECRDRLMFPGDQQYYDNSSQQYDSVRPPRGFADTDVDSADDSPVQRRQTRSAELQVGETRLKSITGDGKKTVHRLDRSRSPVSPDGGSVQHTLNRSTYSIPATLSASLTTADPSSSLGRLHILTKQNEELVKNQKSLESELRRQKRLMLQLQERTKSASLHPDELSSQHLSTLFNESLSMTEQVQQQNSNYQESLRKRISVLEEQWNELTKVNVEQAEKLQQHQQPVASTSDTDFSRQQQSVREEANVLRSTVHRLNQELSRYQTKFRKLDDRELAELAGLPQRGPKPSWLVNMKYLSPLLLAYDDQLKEKDDVIRKHEANMEEFKVKVEDVLKENTKLHVRIEQIQAVGPVGMTTWKNLQEQCKLVLEENELLLGQLDLQEKKYKDLQKTHVHEVLRLSQRNSQMEAKSAQCQREMGELRTKCEELRRQHEELVLADTSKMSVEKHINTLAAHKQQWQDVKTTHSKELSEAAAKQQAVELERDSLSREVNKLNETIHQLQVELRLHDREKKKYQKNIEQLQRAMDKIQSKGSTVEQYLSSVLSTAVKVAEERDDLVQSIEERDREKRIALKKILAEHASKSKMKEKMLNYRQKANEVIDEALHKVKNRESEFGEKCDEYERQIKHLRQLLREKDDASNLLEMEKNAVLDDLETMWQAASKDNRRMLETVRQTDRKLHQHLRTCRLPRDVITPELDDMLDADV